MSKNLFGTDFSFFLTDNAKIEAEPADSAEKSTKRKRTKTLEANLDSTVDRNSSQPVNTGVAEVDYAASYTETNNLIRHTIVQADELGREIKEDIEAVRGSKTIKNKYTYLTNLTASASSILTTKIAAIKELNSTITQSHNLELSRLKVLKLNETAENDDMRMMDLYSSFINTPIGSYAQPQAPSIQDITLGVNGQGGQVSAIEMSGYSNPDNLTPEQNRMRMESNPNIQIVVKYDQASGQRYFDVIDKFTGASVPNYPRPDSFLLEDTTIDVHSRIARNRNINTVWPLVIEGNFPAINEY